jgi:LAO/AO transport system kinase
MENLARNPNAFIRPSPSSGTLGGVARKTRESILLCEAAGFDVIIVETMGVGQGEIAVRSMVDFFLLLQITGAGDELQGIKKGIIEMADAIVINKADGDNIKKAVAAKRELRLAVHYLGINVPGWEIPVLTCSAITGDGIGEIWQTILNFKEKTGAGFLKDLRKKQDIEWMHSVINENIRSFILNNKQLKDEINKLEQQVLAEKVTAGRAALEIVSKLKDKFGENKS